jgi:membrane protease YdiL (CAAX protease family)
MNISSLKSLNIPLLGVALVIDLFLYIDGNAVFGDIFAPYQSVVGIYLVMVTVALAFSGFAPNINIKIESAIITFVPVFIVSLLTFSAVFHVKQSQGMPLDEVILIILFQILVVALSEEIVFRGILLQYLGGKMPAVVLQGIIFGLFHIGAYYTAIGGGFELIVALVEAIIFGIFMGLIVYYFNQMGKGGTGLSITWAIHSAWNLSLSLGIFTFNI